MNKKVIIIGAGGHAKGIADIVLKNNDILIGFLDDNIAEETVIYKEIKVIGKVSDIKKFEDDINYVIGIGNNNIREKISKEYKVKYYIAIHPNSNVAADVKIGEGTVIMAFASVNASAIIGKHCIVNTGAIVEHDNIIGDYVHLSPRVALSGTVKIGNNTHIGTGACVKNNITISNDVVVGVGGVVVKNIDTQGTYIGVPVKKWRDDEKDF